MITTRAPDGANKPRFTSYCSPQPGVVCSVEIGDHRVKTLMSNINLDHMILLMSLEHSMFVRFCQNFNYLNFRPTIIKNPTNLVVEEVNCSAFKIGNKTIVILRNTNTQIQIHKPCC